MKILLDHCTPAPLRHHLTGHVVYTAFERGWNTLRNGALIDIAEADGYDLLITTDQNIRYHGKINSAINGRRHQEVCV